jgi:hypothetical protein
MRITLPSRSNSGLGAHPGQNRLFVPHSSYKPATMDARIAVSSSGRSWTHRFGFGFSLAAYQAEKRKSGLESLGYLWDMFRMIRKRGVLIVGGGASGALLGRALVH